MPPGLHGLPSRSRVHDAQDIHASRAFRPRFATPGCCSTTAPRGAFGGARRRESIYSAYSRTNRLSTTARRLCRPTGGRRVERGVTRRAPYVRAFTRPGDAQAEEGLAASCVPSRLRRRASVFVDAGEAPRSSEEHREGRRSQPFLRRGVVGIRRVG